MQQALRPYVTAGVALVGASMIAVTPVAPSPSVDIQQMRDVALTAGFELPPFGDILTDAETSFTALGTSFKDLFTALSDPSEAFSNLQTAFAAVTFLEGDQKSFIDPVAGYSNEVFTAQLLFPFITAPTNPLDPSEPGLVPESAVPIVNFLASPLSGALIGDASPAIAMAVPFLNPFLELIGDLTSKTSPDFASLGTQLLEAPLNSIFGLFGGSTLNLDLLAPLIAGLIPPIPNIPPITIGGLSMAFGGLFSPGATLNGPGADPDAFPTAITGAGGSIFNNLGLTINIAGTSTTLPGGAVGPIGGLAGLVEVIAQALQGNLPPLEPASSSAADGLTSLFGSGGLDQLFQELLGGSGLDPIFTELAGDFTSIF